MKRKLFAELVAKGNAILNARKSNRNLFGLIVVLFCSFGNIQAQVSSYTFSQSSGTYTAISGGTVSGSGTGLDDGVFSVTLPTAFVYNGISITTVGFSSNGYLVMGNTTSHGNNNPISNSTASNGVISALGMDLVANAATSEQRWQQIGNEIIFQWKEFKRFNSTAFINEVVSFQIRLNTSTGSISFIYDGSTSINASIAYFPQVGLRGTTNSDYNARRLTTSVPDASPAWNDTAAATLNSHNVRFTSTSVAAYPSAGLTFTWSPVSCSGIPTGLTSSSITTTTATITWTAPSSAPANGYEYYYSTSNTTPTASQTPSGTTGAGVATANISLLSAATTYYYWVRSNCNGTDKSAWSTVGNFSTACTIPNNPGAITVTNPLSTGFTLNYAAASPAPTSYILFYTNGTVATAIPTLVSGTTYTDGASYTFGENSYTCITNTSASPQVLTGGTSNTRFNYFLYSKSTTNACFGNPYYSSGVTVSAITCPAAPTLPVASSITTSSATVSWTASVAGGAAETIKYRFELYSDAARTASFGTPYPLTDTTSPVNITGLSASTTYYYRIIAYNSSCSSSNLDGSFTTLCGTAPLTVTQGFNATTLPNCWSVQYPSTSKISFLASGTNPTTSPQLGSHMVRYNSFSNTNGGAGTEERLMTLPISSTGVSSVDLEFQWRNENNTTYSAGAYLNEGVQIQYSLNGTTWTNVPSGYYARHDGSLTSGTSQWNKKTLTLPVAVANQSLFYVAFKFRSEYGDNMFLDEVVIKPTPNETVDYANIQFPGVSTTTTGTSVDIFGQAYEPGVTDPAGAATGLVVWYSKNATDVDPSSAGWTGTWTLATFNTNVGNNDEWKGAITPIPGQADTYYSFRYQLNGGPMRYGGYSGTGGGFWNGTTNKNGKLSVNYEVYTTAVAPNNTVNNTIDVYLRDFDGVANFYTDAQTSIWMYAGVQVSSASQFQYIGTTSQDFASTSTLVEFVRQTTNPNVYKATIKFADYFCIPAATNVEGINLLFRNQYSNAGNDKTTDLFLDLTDTTVTVTAPTLTATTAITTATATINWTAPTTGAVKGYEYYYSTSNTAPTAGTTPSGSTLAGVTTANLTLLSPTTTYYVWARTKGCGSSVSAWSTIGSFTTACGTITAFPFTETFETSSASRNCWTQIQEVGSYSWTYATGAGAGTITSAHGGSLNARFVSITGTASAITKLISPAMDLTTVTNPVLGFWYGQELWTGQQNTLKIYYRVDSSSSWIQLAHYTGNVNTWTEIENLVLPNPSATYQIAFEGINNYGRANVVDDVTIKANVPTIYTWNGSSSTSWDTAVNWTPNGIPGSSDHIIVTGTSVPNKLNIVTNKTVTNFELAGSDATSFSLTGTNSLTIKGTVAYTGTATAVLNCASTVIINNASNQLIPPLTYGNLNAMGGNRTFSPTGVIKICSAFSVGPPYSYTVTGSTVEYFSSDTGWTMVPFTYNNLTFSGTGDFTLEDGTITVGGNFVQSAGTLYLGYLDDAALAITGNMTLGNGVINSRDAFDTAINVGGNLNILNGGSLLSYSNNGTDTVNVTGNANISGTGSWSIWSDVSSVVTINGDLVLTGTSANAIEVDGASTISVNGNFSQSNTSRIFLADGNTTVFNVEGNFTLADTSIFNLNVSSGGNSTVNLKGNLTVSTGSTLTATNANIANFNFTGTTNQIVSGAGTIEIFRSTINKPSGYVDLQRDLIIRRILTMTSGNIVTNTNTLTLGQNAGNPGTLTYTSGFVVGKMTRWFATGATTGNNGLFPLGTATNENRFATINYASVTTAGRLTAEVVETAMGAFSPITVAAAGSCPLFEAKTGDTFYWKLTNNAIVATNYTAAFRKQTATATPLCSLTLLNRNPTNWLGTGTHITTSGTTTNYTVSRSGLTAYGDFGIGIKGLCGTTKTWASGAWTGGDGFAPTVTDAVIFAGNYNTQTTPALSNVSSCECTINPGATVTIDGGKTLTIENSLTLSDNGTIDPLDDGKLIILNNGSLVQVTDVDNATANTNTGKINMERITKPMYRYDFTYWSSPVFADNDSSNDSISVANGTEFNLKRLSPMTFFDKYYKWGHAGAGWITIPVGVESMVPGRGYIVRAPQSYATDATNPASYQPYTANFIGKPNNGTIRHAVSGGADQWNLLGNPYPSAISADSFFDANVGSANGSTNTLEGTIYLWTHNTKITPTGTPHIYSYSAGDYAAYNGTGSTNTKEAESDPTPEDEEDNLPTGFIAAGQSFFIKGTAAGEAVFNNSMRVAGNNNQFFRPASTEPLNNWDMTGKHRVWLNMKGQIKGFSQLLVGYVPNATNDFDIRFDGESLGGNQVTFYSLLSNKNLTIQGRTLPFNNQDQVPLGYKSTLNGMLTISIDQYDGLFEGQDIYLEDKLLNIVHDLKASAYSFTSTTGTFNERFVLRYLPSEELGNHDHNNIANGLIIYQEDARIKIKSQLEDISQIMVYDLLGRIVFDQNSIAKREFSIQNVVMNEQPLIVKVKLANGQIVNKKIVH